MGTKVAARLQAADFEIVTYDPLKATREPAAFQSCSLEELYQVDLLCIHAELHSNPPYPTTNLINQNVLDRLKPGCIIINAARGGIVNEVELLYSSKSLIYCTDVYLDEPDINARVIDKSTICTPHIAGHSLEAKYAAVAVVSSALHQIARLAPPQFAAPLVPQFLSYENDKLWYETILKIYNPLEETLLLKQATDKKAAFLSLRKNHQTRHDFSQYFVDSTLNYKTKLLLGL